MQAVEYFPDDSILTSREFIILMTRIFSGGPSLLFAVSRKTGKFVTEIRLPLPADGPVLMMSGVMDSFVALRWVSWEKTNLGEG